MTDKEAMKLALEALEQWKCYMPDYWDKWDEEAIAALKERSAQEKALQALHNENERLGLYRDAYGQPEQEPVAWIWKDMRGQEIVSLFEPRLNSVPLYTHPPQRTEQEPVAVVDVHEFYDNCANFSLLQKLPKGKHTLYTTPPQRKPLLASEIVTMYAERPTSDNDMIEFARAIEAAHGIKENT